MHRCYLPNAPFENEILEIEGDEARHALRVMRLRAGDVCEVFDGAGNAAIAEIIACSGEYETEEGCLSLLGGPRKTKRFQKIKVKYQNLELQTRLKTFTGWTAQIIQHEIDHCNGILI